MANSYKYFENKDCKYYPCHKSEHINCMFCCCPLYSLPDCGGNYKILPNGIKDCSDCMFPHEEKNYQKVMDILAEYCHKLAKEDKFIRK